MPWVRAPFRKCACSSANRGKILTNQRRFKAMTCTNKCQTMSWNLYERITGLRLTARHKNGFTKVAVVHTQASLVAYTATRRVIRTVRRTIISRIYSVMRKSVLVNASRAGNGFFYHSRGEKARYPETSIARLFRCVYIYDILGVFKKRLVE